MAVTAAMVTMTTMTESKILKKKKKTEVNMSGGTNQKNETGRNESVNNICKRIQKEIQRKYYMINFLYYTRVLTHTSIAFCNLFVFVLPFFFFYFFSCLIFIFYFETFCLLSVRVVRRQL